jgi:hypothetical protein
VKWFFDGLPAGQSLPWGVWVVPLFWWLSLMAVVLFVAFCLITILRKQWVENEKLLFPLVEMVYFSHGFPLCETKRIFSLWLAVKGIMG